MNRYLGRKNGAGAASSSSSMGKNSQTCVDSKLSICKSSDGSIEKDLRRMEELVPRALTLEGDVINWEPLPVWSNPMVSKAVIWFSSMVLKAA